jgi:serine/threonine protein kinase
MTPDRWLLVKEVLGLALDLDPVKRSQYLDQACGADVALRQDLERLLAAEQKAGPAFLNTPVILEEIIGDLPQHPETWIGRRLGAYQIVEQIGLGGMGEVYRAVRADDEYHKQVAIKLVRSGQDSSFVLDRFRNERQILASLDHPNIARLLDGATTEEGLPYFVLELVEGQRLDEYCNARQLPIPERLQLFLQICSAVQYAHQRLIVHRDIKPGNILVTGEGVPKLLDFGIAKILDSSGGVIQADQTLSIFRLLTPEYASPEQVKSEAITTASDVYSLGVVLYELLTGCTPYRVVTRTPHEISLAVCEIEPEKPSVAVRRTPPQAGGQEHNVKGPAGFNTLSDDARGKLAKSLRGDLDNIILMALRKEPLRRYASVEQFAEDIRRHLTHLPVVAHKVTAGYRASKFVSRNRVGVALGVMVIVSLLGAFGITLREARIARAERARAERRFNDVRKLANSLLFDIHDSIKDLPGSTPSRKLLVSRALEYLDSLNQEARGDLSLQRELAAAYEKIGDVQGQPRQANLGDSAGAESSYRKALAIRETLASANSKNTDLKRDLVPGYGKLSDLLWTKGDITGTMENSRKGLEVTEAVYRADPSNPANRFLLAIYSMDHGYKQAIAAGDRANGLESLRKGSAMLEQLASENPQNLRTRRLLGLSYSRAAEILQESPSDRAQAAALFEKAIATKQALVAADPNNTDFQRMVAYDQFQSGQLLANMGNMSGALMKDKEALSAFEKLAAEDPANLQFRQDTAQVRGQMGEILTRRGELSNAVMELQLSLKLLENMSGAGDPRSWAGFILASDQFWLGKAHSLFASSAKAPLGKKVEHCKEAQSWFQKCLPAFKLFRDHPKPGNGDDGRVKEIEKEIAGCSAILGKAGDAHPQ